MSSSFTRALSRAFAIAKPLTTAIPKSYVVQPLLSRQIAPRPPILAAFSLQSRLFRDQAREPRENTFGAASASGNPIGWNIERSSNVYVGNLFFDAQPEDIKEFFVQYGKVNEVKIVNDIRGFSKGFAFIEFNDVEAAQKAVDDAHGKVLSGRRMAVNYAAKRPSSAQTPHKPSPTLFVGNLAYDVTDKELNQLFRPLRNIRDVRVAIDRRTGQPRGFAHADFVDVNSCVAARKRLEGVEIRSRQLKLDYSHSSRNAAAFQHARSTGALDLSDPDSDSTIADSASETSEASEASTTPTEELEEEEAAKA